jgi:ADP-ribose pyrophosphatase YjhB (NUDIX family)
VAVTLADLVPAGAEAGVGLALQDEAGRYLFFLAGTRHRCPPGERFYAGIGGHREEGETWAACAHREAEEEIGVDVELLPAAATWHLPHGGVAREVEVANWPRPLALYEMVHPAGTPRAGALYRIVIYTSTSLR